MNNPLPLTVSVLLLAVSKLSAATLYVSLESTNPTPPYTNWQTAARVAQDAVDAAAASDQIMVTNGTYAEGGRAVDGTMTNRVVVNKPLTVRSVNGPEVTIIQGSQVGGDGAIRCVYLVGGATFSGFTLTKGATRNLFASESQGSGGGLWCASTTAVVSNCVVAGNGAFWAGGGAYGGTLNNCTLTGNWANIGGGAYYGSLNNCTVSGNSAQQAGGGAWEGNLSSCTVTGNSSTIDGGGTYSANLNNCTVSSNTAGVNGGGAGGGTLYNCTLSSNSANTGGGANNAMLVNCTLTGNSAYQGGGVYDSTVWHCTLTYNSATGFAGGACASTLDNCIVYYNTRNGGATPDNYNNCTFNYCCTTPQPTTGTGNISVDPQLASTSHLSATSPCRGAGTAAYTSGTDIDGEAWANPPSIGCDEYHVGAVTGPLNVRLFFDSKIGFGGKKLLKLPIFKVLISWTSKCSAKF